MQNNKAKNQSENRATKNARRPIKMRNNGWIHLFIWRDAFVNIHLRQSAAQWLQVEPNLN